MNTIVFGWPDLSETVSYTGGNGDFSEDWPPLEPHK